MNDNWGNGQGPLHLTDPDHAHKGPEETRPFGEIGRSQHPFHWASSQQTPRVPRTFSKTPFPRNHNHPKLGNSPKLHSRFLIAGVSVTGLLFIDKQTSSAVILQQVNGATITDLLVKLPRNNAPWQLGWLSHRYLC